MAEIITDGFFLSLIIAALGGGLSFLSPCVLPLVPAYLCFAAGLEFDALHQADRRTINGRILPAALSFVGGFSLVFISLGAGAAAIHPLILTHKILLGQIAGIFIILLGLHVAGLLRFGWLNRQWRFALPLSLATSRKSTRLLTGFGLGLAFAFGWTPCIGPILATILTLAASSDSLAQGTILLTAYAAGLGLPFILAALGMGYFLHSFARLKKYMPIIEKITGGLIILTGVLIFLGSLQNIGGALLDWFPILGRLG